MIDSAASHEGGGSRIGPWLSSFSCEKDSEIADYLHNRAAKFEVLGKSRTYLACDRDVLLKEHDLHIYGFFSVALKVLDLPETLSNRKRLDLDGFSAKMRGEVIKSVPCYLIGQLAKNSSVPDAISGAELLRYAIQIIASAAGFVGGRYALIECRNDPHLRKFYSDNEFVEFDSIPDEDGPVDKVPQLNRNMI